MHDMCGVCVRNLLKISALFIVYEFVVSPFALPKKATSLLF
jgi:hypothetical protein